MPKWGYTITDLDPENTAKASGRELRVSPKKTVEVCNAIKGMQLEQAKKLLRSVIERKTPIPFRHYKKKQPHTRGLQKTYAGKYPKNAAKSILKLLESAEANAEFKGLDIERLRVTHATAYPGMKLKRITPRAFGRSSPKIRTLTHVEVVLEQTEESEIMEET